MSGNQLKAIACLTMLIDHIGYMLFPELLILRYVGRIAMPLFAYCVAEGCRYTRSRVRYFVGVFSLAVLCQLVYSIPDILNGGVSQMYFNILFTFCLSILVCCSFLDVKAAAEQIAHHRLLVSVLRFCVAVAFAIFCCTRLGRLVGVSIEFDYGVAGVFLPLFAVVYADKERQLPLFTVGVFLFNLLLCHQIPYIWFSLLAIPLIWFYSGLRGTYRIKSAYYLFYPLHFAMIYAVKWIIG